MESVFLDVNILLDIYERNSSYLINGFTAKPLISALSVHICAYLSRVKIRNRKYEQFISLFDIVPFDHQIIENSILGPTEDFEDNVQLNSAAIAGCNKFITNDKKLLKMGVFGLMKICSTP